MGDRTDSLSKTRIGPDVKAELVREARALGFSGCAVADPAGIAAAGARLGLWLDAGRHAGMDWMARRAAWRADPRALWPETRSVVMVTEAHAPGDAATPPARRDRGAIARHAWGRDYHDRVKKRLKRLGRWLIGRAGGDIKVFVDTAPVMEKPLAQAAGLGWQGKHTNLVSRDLGSWFFLGAIFTTLDLAKDAPHDPRCGTCRACLDICPTAAFPAPFQLDAARCISYLTIELKGAIPRPMRPLIGNRIYGCDDCLAVCPWNKFAARARDAGPPDADAAPDLADLATLTDAGFRTRFSGSAIKRVGRDRFLRNTAVAVGNSATPALIPTAMRLAGDESPLVRLHAVWALSRLTPPGEFLRLAAREGAEETDGAVAAEWALCRAEAAARMSPAPPSRARAFSGQTP